VSDEEHRADPVEIDDEIADQVAANLPEAEPESGPEERQRQFIAERMTRLRPKDAPEESAPSSAPDLEGAPTEPEFPDALHRDAVRQYRERQRRQSEESADYASTSEEEAHPAPGESEPPEPPDPAPASNWIPIGPSVLRQGQGGVKPATSGRTPGISVFSGGDTVYIASHNGGAWRSDDAGENWRPLMNAFDLNPGIQAADSLACGAVIVDPNDADRVFVGTGEGAASGSAFFGVGPIMSSDGGLNWTTEPVAPGSPELAGSSFFRLAMDPADPDRVVAASRRGVYRREPDGAGGFHYAQKTLGGVGTQIVTDVVVARSGGVTTFVAARQNGPVYSSTDGHTWTELGTGLPAGLARVSLAMQEGNPNVVYALSANARIFRLNVAEGTWREATGVPSGFLGTQGWYDLAIAVAPNNVNRIYLGGSTVLSGGDWSGSVYRCEVTVAGAAVSLAPTYIGNSVHADIHALVFAPGDANKLWVGCDGGVFYSTNPTGFGDIFNSRNTGLATLSMNFLGQHPTEDAVLFSGTQDNGGVRYTGEEAWLYSSGGDGGFAVINWHDPYKVLSTYVAGSIRRSTDGGTRYSYSNVNVPLVAGDSALFYAPIAGTPHDPTSATPAADADIVAFGSIRPWISTTFGGGWQSIPNNTLAGDSLNGSIKSITFASATKLYAGTMNGGVYRLDNTGAGWTRVQIDTLGGANQLPLSGPVTDIAVDSADATGNSVYITLGGFGDYRHVWHFDNTSWEHRSGPAAGSVDALLDVQHSAIATDPSQPTHVYVGADIGIWRSPDSGATWEPFSQGLPDAAVLDLKLHDGRRLLRAGTHGRSAWERRLDTATASGVELYVRDTQLDQGRFATVNFLPDPTAQGSTVRHWFGPDIKLDTPDAMGNYQFPLGSKIDFHDFVDVLSDDARNVATHATSTIITRAYVQVHNRGLAPAANVQVMALLANASAGLPALPPGYELDVQNGTQITTSNWQTLGIATLPVVEVGFPQIAAFDLPSSMLPPPANLAGNDHHCVLALLHHPGDPYTSTQTNTDLNSLQERKAAHKNLKVVQFTGTLPTPLVLPFKINNAWLEQNLLTTIRINLNGYPGHVRIFLPRLKIEGELERHVSGAKVGREYEEFRAWAGQHVEMIKRNQRSRFPYHREWSRARIEDLEQILETDVMLTADDNKQVEISQIQMDPGGSHTLFMMINRPPNGRVGDTHTIQIEQWDTRRRTPIGSLTTRVELVPEPDLKPHTLELSTRRYREEFLMLRARLHGPDGMLVTPEAGASVRLTLQGAQSVYTEPIAYHGGWKLYWHLINLDSARTLRTVAATAFLNGVAAGHAEIAVEGVHS
jgi:hypothetical protein